MTTDDVRRTAAGQSSGALHLPPAPSESFRVASPFPHVVLEDVLPPKRLAELSEAFPPPDWGGWRRYRDSYQREKMINSEILAFPAALRDLVVELSSPPFLEFLEAVSGIRGLIPDPYLEGGGLHCSGPGGVLAPHTDFHTYERLGVYRRINVILYLNPHWGDGGGELQLFADESARVADVSVLPLLGRMVIFRTDHSSVHGVTNPVAEGRWRRSVALYYYTASEALTFSGDATTYWRAHGPSSGLERAQLRVYQLLLFLAKGFSYLAHRANPHLRTDREPSYLPSRPRRRAGLLRALTEARSKRRDDHSTGRRSHLATSEEDERGAPQHCSGHPGDER